MTTYYQVRAHESDTLKDTVFEGSTPSFDLALDHAERWAAQYYGGKETTWSTSDGDGRYLVGRMHENGDREPVTCIITVEEDAGDEQEFPESRRRR
jgi:hypothetical protein